MATRKTARHRGVGGRSGFTSGFAGDTAARETLLPSQNAKPLPEFLLLADQVAAVVFPQRAPESVIPHSLILLSRVL
jgi:hypothetical protein